MYKEELFKITNQQAADNEVNDEEVSPELNVNLLNPNNVEQEKPKEENDDFKIGIVTNCNKLNVRKEPYLGAEITCEIIRGTELIINGKESSDEFYKVYTISGINGFCMKKFVGVEP